MKCQTTWRNEVLNRRVVSKSFLKICWYMMNACGDVSHFREVDWGVSTGYSTREHFWGFSGSLSSMTDRFPGGYGPQFYSLETVWWHFSHKVIVNRCKKSRTNSQQKFVNEFRSFVSFFLAEWNKVPQQLPNSLRLRIPSAWLHEQTKFRFTFETLFWIFIWAEQRKTPTAKACTYREKDLCNIWKNRQLQFRWFQHFTFWRCTSR